MSESERIDYIYKCLIKTHNVTKDNVEEMYRKYTYDRKKNIKTLKYILNSNIDYNPDPYILKAKSEKFECIVRWNIYRQDEKNKQMKITFEKIPAGMLLKIAYLEGIDIRNKSPSQVCTELNYTKPSPEWFERQRQYILNTKHADLLIELYTYDSDPFNYYVRGKHSQSIEALLDVHRNHKYNYSPFLTQALEKHSKDDDVLSETGRKVLESQFKDSWKDFIEANRVKFNANYVNDTIYLNAIEIAVKELDTIIRNAPPIDKSIIVYRGLTEYDWFKPKAENKGFSSTSLNIQVSMDFGLAGDDQMYAARVNRIVLLKGMPCLVVLSYGGNVEREIILPNNTRFDEIDGFETRNLYNYYVPLLNTAYLYMNTLVALQ